MNPTSLLPLFLLFIANLFMTFAWYGHLKYLGDKPLWLAVLVSWGIAFFEYWFQVPANRLGAGTFSVPQLKIAQEAITLAVFSGFAVWVLGVKLTLDYLWASLCLVGAVYFMFRGGVGG